MFKYASIIGAKAILDSNAIRYSRSSEFNDPFDISIDALYGKDIFLDKGKMAEILIDKLASNRKIISSDYNSPLMAKMLQFQLSLKSSAELKDFKKQLGFSLLPDNDVLKEKEKVTINAIKILFEQDAVTCFSKKKDIVPMWAHYAKNHTGVVFEFTPNKEGNSCLMAAESVRYSEVRPLFHHTYDEFVENTFFKEFDVLIKEKVEALHFTKSCEWKYEEELRVVVSQKVPVGQKYLDIPLFENEISSVYFGCRTVDDDVFAIMEKGLKLNPQMNFYKMKVDTHEYVLNANKIE